MNEQDIKEMVREKYNNLALLNGDNETGCCCGGKSRVYTIMRESYTAMPGYNPDADMGLGCGLPTKFALIKAGDTVIDLGSGAGNDCFVASAEVGETGKVIGIDFSAAMIDKAKHNAQNRGYNNIKFILGDIEDLPVKDNIADVVVSNCVLNLVPNKTAVFAEIYRVLKPEGHFSISDIVITGDLPAKIKSAAEMYAGCVASAINKEDYMDYIRNAQFKDITIQKEKPIIVPDEILKQYLNEQEIAHYKSTPTVIFSISVYAKKP